MQAIDIAIVGPYVLATIVIDVVARRRAVRNLQSWLRRSGVLTGAEWIETRFGCGPGGRLSQFFVIAFAVAGVLGYLAYGFLGISKFIEIFLPWSAAAPYAPFEVVPANVANFYGVVFTAITMIYAILGGMFSIVWTDVLQFTVTTVASVIVAVIAIERVDPALLGCCSKESS